VSLRGCSDETEIEWGLELGGSYHAVSAEVGVCVEDTVGGRVIASCVHGIRASLVEGGLYTVVSESLARNSKGNNLRERELTGNRTSRVVKPVILTILTEIQQVK
jgi:hypothetical protein